MIRAPALAWIVGATGLVVAVFGWRVQPIRFQHAWLAALAVWLEWPLGSLALLLVHALTGGAWGLAIRPALLRGLATLPLLLPALVPVALHLDTLYPWARPGADYANGFYLNAPFFSVRLLIDVIVWFGLGAQVLRAMRLPDAVVPAGLAAPGLILLAVTVTFAAIDLILSLDPDFNSSVWGMIAAAGCVLLALAAASLAMAASAKPAVLRDLGRLLLGLVVLWAYLDFMQFLIVWESDLPPEAAWYARRSQGDWGIVAAVIAVGHFFLPFAALIFPSVQRSRIGIGVVAAWLIAMEILRMWWLVLPAAPGLPSWVDAGCLLCFGGFGLALARDIPRRVLARG